MLYYWLYIHHHFYTLSLNLVTVYLFAQNALDFTCLLSLNFFSTIIKSKIIWNSYVWQTEEEKEDNSKQQTTEVLSEPKEKEDRSGSRSLERENNTQYIDDTIEGKLEASMIFQIQESIKMDDVMEEASSNISNPPKCRKISFSQSIPRIQHII